MIEAITSSSVIEASHRCFRKHFIDNYRWLRVCRHLKYENVENLKSKHNETRNGNLLITYELLNLKKPRYQWDRIFCRYLIKKVCCWMANICFKHIWFAYSLVLSQTNCIETQQKNNNKYNHFLGKDALTMAVYSILK